jgi:hypothetical protein
MAVKTVEYHEEQITLLYAQLVELQQSPVTEYQSDNSGQRMGVKYRTPAEIQKWISWHEKQISRIKSKGGRALAVFRRGC